MIGILSFLLCIVAWVVTILMTFVYELSGRQHNRATFILFLTAMVVFAIVSYL